MRHSPSRFLGLGMVLSLLTACGAEVLEDNGFRLRCDLGCGPQGRDILAGMIEARDSVTVWFQGVDSERSSGATRNRRTGGKVRLYGAAAPFERADSRLAKGRYREQRAFSHARSRSAHILPEERPDPERWARFGPGIAGPRLAVHEASHLAMYGLAEDPRWPSWVAEGIAGLVEEQWARRRDGEDTWLQTRDHVRQVLLYRGDLPGWDAILGGNLDPLPLPSRYAVWAGFMDVLLSPAFREETQQALAALAAKAPAGGWSLDSVREVFERGISPERRRAIEAQFQEGIRSLSPRWVELARGSQVEGSARLQVPADGKGALLWHLPRSPDAPDPACLSVSGTPIGDDELALVLLLGQDTGVAEGVVVWAHEAPTPFSLRLGIDLPQDVIPLRREGSPPPPGEDVWIPAGTGFHLLLRRDGRSFALRNERGEEHRWEASVETLGPGWGIGLMGAAGVLWEDIETDCPEQDRG